MTRQQRKQKIKDLIEKFPEAFQKAMQDFKANGWKIYPERENIEALCQTIKREGIYSKLNDNSVIMAQLNSKLNTKEFLTGEY